jgi:hypothetical protein
MNDRGSVVSSGSTDEQRMDTEECASCRFWLDNPEAEVDGFCQRHAPQPLILSVPYKEGPGREPWVLWPQTPPSEWCGEWQGRQ